MLKERLITLVWKGLYYDSREACAVSRRAEGYEASSFFAGRAEGRAVGMRYTVACDAEWRFSRAEIFAQLEDESWMVMLEYARGGWLVDGAGLPSLHGCTTIDISLTPFTNTLAINALPRIARSDGKVSVAYVDVMNRRVVAVEQVYRQTGDLTWHFETVPPDFAALIQVDRSGFVVDYPGLFERVDPTPENSL